MKSNMATMHVLIQEIRRPVRYPHLGSGVYRQYQSRASTRDLGWLGSSTTLEPISASVVCGSCVVDPGSHKHFRSVNDALRPTAGKVAKNMCLGNRSGVALSGEG